MHVSDFPFDFVFLIPLRNVDENCSLAELVADEHDLEKEDVDLLQTILTSKTKHKVLLLLDGYDEYTPGTNTEVDRVIEKRKGNSFVILTSRPKEGRDFTKKLGRKWMVRWSLKVSVQKISRNVVLGTLEVGLKLFFVWKDVVTFYF